MPDIAAGGGGGSTAGSVFDVVYNQPAAGGGGGTTAQTSTSSTSGSGGGGTSGGSRNNIIDIIIRIAKRYGVPPALALAVAYHESGLDPNIAGDGGHSIGLYQLYDQGLGAGMSVAQRQDPATNAEIAIKHLAGVLNDHPDWSWGKVAAVSQNPADHASYRLAINGLVRDQRQQGATAAAYYTRIAHEPSSPGGGGDAGGFSGGGGGGDIGSGKPMTVKGYLHDPVIAQNYGYLLGYLHDPELGPIIAKAAKNGWSEDRLFGAISKTHWWKHTSESARAWEQQQQLDPASARQRLHQRIRDVQQLAQRTLGFRLKDHRAEQIANTSIGSDWSQAQLQAAIGSEFHYHQGREAFAGAAGQTIDTIKEMAQAYLVPLANHTIDHWTRKVLKGNAEVGDYESYLKDQAKSLFPTLASAIDSGTTVRQYLDPYAQLWGQTLEKNPAQIDWFNPKWMKALNTTTPDGKRAPMSLSDWATYLRSQKSYRETQGATDQAYSFASNLAQTFGKVNY